MPGLLLCIKKVKIKRLKKDIAHTPRKGVALPVSVLSSGAGCVGVFSAMYWDALRPSHLQLSAK